ncbi:hypothetical protein CEJ42_12990 [Herbaspirillum robiniae]|uniref:Uncharacterized protein n=2 Tax=Herbaspirillum robiniae TaxID=2014887 RepID=A0A246WT90_9BURK|nr:hypothetical protein CEJ42_12990 [Herbaspirillum robiniae]
MLLAACVAQKIEMQQQSLGQMSGKRLAVVAYELPTFVDFKAGNAVFGIIGVLAAQEQGKALVRQYHVEDPAFAMADLLARRMAQERGMSILPPPAVPLGKDDIGSVVTAQPEADYILDIKTTGWATMYFASDWTHYKVDYSARLRLIDSRSKQVLAQQACRSVQSENDPHPPSKDELLAHNASLLKQRLVLGAADCMNGFANDALKLAAASQQTYTLPADAAGKLDPALAGEPDDGLLLAIASSDAVHVTDKSWSAVMSCGASNAAHPSQPSPFTRNYDVDVSRYPVIRLHRRSTTVTENIAGRVINGRMALRGTGYRVENPANRWSVRLDGAFNGDGSTWEGSGGLLVRNSLDRACTMSMKKS